MLAWSPLTIPPSQAHTDSETESASQYCAGNSRRERITDGKLPQHCDDSEDTYQAPIKIREGVVLPHSKRIECHKHSNYMCTLYWAIGVGCGKSSMSSMTPSTVTGYTAKPASKLSLRINGVLIAFDHYVEKYYNRSTHQRNSSYPCRCVDTTLG